MIKNNNDAKKNGKLIKKFILKMMNSKEHKRMDEIIQSCFPEEIQKSLNVLKEKITKRLQKI